MTRFDMSTSVADGSARERDAEEMLKRVAERIVACARAPTPSAASTAKSRDISRS